MNKKYIALLKDTAIFASGSFGSKIILFFLVPLYTNYLSTEEYGIAELVTTFVSLVVPFSAVSIGQALIRFGMMKTERPENALKASFCVFFVSILVTLLLVPIVCLYEPIKPWKWYLGSLVVLTNLSEIERTYLKVKNKNRTFALISIIQTFVLALSNIFLLTVFQLGVKGYLLANISALFCTSLVGFFTAQIPTELHKGVIDRVLLKRMVGFSFPLIFSSVSWWVIHSSDKIMIEWMIGASVLGIYTAATKIPSLINVIIGVFNQAWGLSSFREIESSNKEHFFVTVFEVFSTMLFGISIIFTSIMKPFMNVYVGEAFQTAWRYTPLLLSAAVFYSVSAFLGTIYAAIQKTTNDMWTSVLCAVINVTVNFFGILKFGVWGAILGTLIAFFVVSTLRLYDIQRYIRLGIDMTRFWLNALLMLVHAVLISADFHILVVSILSCTCFFMLNTRIFVCYLKRIKV